MKVPHFSEGVFLVRVLVTKLQTPEVRTDGNEEGYLNIPMTDLITGCSIGVFVQNGLQLSNDSSP